MDMEGNGTDSESWGTISKCYSFHEALLLEVMEYGRVMENAFSLSPYYEGIPQAVLNVGVLLSIVTIMRTNRSSPETSSSNERPAFMFIANLALADLVMGGVQIWTIDLRRQLEIER